MLGTNMIKKIPIGLLLFYSTITLADINESATAKIITADRDWAYFKAIPCTQLKFLAVTSNNEKALLAKRKFECQKIATDKYKAFFKRPVSHQ